MTLQIIPFDSKFQVRVTLDFTNLVKNSKLKIFLKEEGYKFSCKTHTLHNYYFVDCDNFTDAAKLETFLCTA